MNPEGMSFGKGDIRNEGTFYSDDELEAQEKSAAQNAHWEKLLAARERLAGVEGEDRSALQGEVDDLEAEARGDLGYDPATGPRGVTFH